MRKNFYWSLGVMALLISTAVYALPEDVLRALDEPDKLKVKKPKPVHKEQPKQEKKKHRAKKQVVEVEEIASELIVPVVEPTATETRQPFEPEMVKFSNGKWIAKYEVTIGEYMACVEEGSCKNPEWLESGNKYNINTGSKSYYVGMSLNNKSYPVTGVSWNDTQSYIGWLNEKTGKKYTLPTKEEWMSSCQAGSNSKYSGAAKPDDVAWYNGNSGDMIHPVGQKTANVGGLYDMSGNVWEWTNSQEGDKRVLRGGAFNNNGFAVRCGARDYKYPDDRFYDLGFRLSR